MGKLNFIVIGAAGYIAPKHLKAIKATGNEVIAAFDPFDSVGILDSYFPDANFFTEFERLDRHIEKIKRNGVKIDFVSVCSPNYLHDAHIRYGLRIGANVICEKPLVLNPWNMDALSELESEYPGKVYSILQLRHHESIKRLKESQELNNSGEKTKIELTYFTSRGKWYHQSWKGNESKSGGIATNIGVHFFDMLIWVFGEVEEITMKVNDKVQAAGTLVLERAIIEWNLSIDFKDIPEHLQALGHRVYRSLKIGEQEFDFSEGFTDLHTICYEEILQGRGFPLRASYPAIELVSKIRNIDPGKTETL